LSKGVRQKCLKGFVTQPPFRAENLPELWRKRACQVDNASTATLVFRPSYLYRRNNHVKTTANSLDRFGGAGPGRHRRRTIGLAVRQRYHREHSRYLDRIAERGNAGCNRQLQRLVRHRHVGIRQHERRDHPAIVHIWKLGHKRYRRQHRGRR
jgi:hypothetical protein